MGAVGMRQGLQEEGRESIPHDEVAAAVAGQEGGDRSHPPDSHSASSHTPPGRRLRNLQLSPALHPGGARRMAAASAAPAPASAGWDFTWYFAAVEARFLRASFSAFVDLMVLVTKIVEEYGVAKEGHS
uniref:Uncharacterized protein n=1 Tax=Arundo donax TaxID=35708 RepID=A0A0A9BZ05_ARUDO